MSKKEESVLTKNRVIELGLDKVSVITADMLDGYTCIGQAAFYNCTHLISVTIPNSITRIEGIAFYWCTGLTSITIPNSVTSIEVEAFAYCTGLTSMTIPNSVTSIGERAFFDCKNLTSITIPNSIISIDNDAFYGCIGLASVRIGGKEYKTQEVKDGKCKAYKAFNADMTCRDFQYKEGETYEFDGKPVLCMQGFHACLNLADVFNYYGGKLGRDIVIHEVELEGVSDERHNDSKVVAKKITIGNFINYKNYYTDMKENELLKFLVEK